MKLAIGLLDKLRAGPFVLKPYFQQALLRSSLSLAAEAGLLALIYEKGIDFGLCLPDVEILQRRRFSGKCLAGEKYATQRAADH